MLQIERFLQIAFLILVGMSGLLLGFSQRDPSLAFVAIGSAVSGLVLCDWLKLIRLRSWVANILSVIVLIFAMRTFFDGDSGGQLIAVANLLVYLQLVLLFQEKSPRLYWQIAVLSLLQVVVATIFNLQFEGGIFFVFYMLLASVSLTLLSIYHQNWLANRDASKTIRKMDSHIESGGPYVGTSTPLVAFDQTIQDNRIFRRMVWHLGMWVLVSLIFSGILFYKIPRTDSAWFGPQYFSTSATGANKSLELDERDRLQLSSEIVMRCWFEDSKSGEKIQLNHQPYFRGMALSNVTIENGITAFKAPYDRVYGFVYDELPFMRDGTQSIRMNVTLESTSDPLIYSCMPGFRNKDTPKGIEFCHELSAINRRRQGDRIEMSPFKYTLSIPNKLDKTLPKAWPYRPESAAPSAKTMAGNLGQYRWLTSLDESRYPELVRRANEIAEQTPDPNNPYLVARELTQSFLLSNEFEYTIDFRNVERDDSLDPIEDFVRNHKTGHCSLYAAALCLMLRSQGIPARVVVGYMGGSYNELGGFYLVTGQHAHSWVEAYIPPEYHTPELEAFGGLGNGGSWLTLDATPETPLDFSAGEDALDLARTLWQDYVLGLDTEQQSGGGWFSSNSAIIGLFDINNWGNQFQESFTAIKSSPLLSTLALIAGVAAMIIFPIINARRSKKQKALADETPVGAIRRFLGKAVSLISPNLGTWIIHGSDSVRIIAFYEKLSAILKKQGLVRKTDQTHREFASQVASQYVSHQSSDQINDIMNSMTELFNRVRFGADEIELEEARKVEADLAILESMLAKN